MHRSAGVHISKFPFLLLASDSAVLAAWVHVPALQDPESRQTVSCGNMTLAQGPSPSLLKIVYKRVLRRLSSLPLAISEMGFIAALSAVGTIIEQNKPIQFYVDNYPDGEKKVGCLAPLAAPLREGWASPAPSCGAVPAPQGHTDF